MHLQCFGFMGETGDSSFGVPPLGGFPGKIVTSSRGPAKAGTPSSIRPRIKNHSRVGEILTSQVRFF